ncbi:MAG: glycosyl hydrolase [Isosphaera sp.]|nr:glycosyl hydrolase [Isosphaera sp.]
MSPALLLALALAPAQTGPQPGKPDDKPAEKGLPIAALRPRLVGPAVTSGRVVGFAVHPTDRSRYFVAVASGGVWKTTNAGTTWAPVFDNEGSYSIGCVVLDPKNPSVVWVGTGENNSQRSVGYGDGVYKSTDGGKTWANVGLKQSEHVGKIVIDPRDSDTVYVAAQGPLWKEGGDRGLHKTTDGGKTWAKVLSIDDNTGVTDVVLDPRNPDVLVAASWQRRRHVWTIINGGPGSAIHRSTDAGKTWKKVTAGLPAGDLGRIGLATAPSDPDTVYAIVEAADGAGGIHRSTDRGVTWEKRNPFAAQAQYYSHLVVDPANKDRLYAMNVRIQVSDDGGRTLAPLSENWKHVDNHTLWIDPKDPKFYLCGCDGGVYESFDRGANWHMKPNLPVTQFYDVTCDQSGPFYHVYGGTQDNFTLGGPARTRSRHGIMNQDWFVVQGGDGFHCKVDPTDPNIVYAEYQYAGLCRYDRRTGQRVQIQPQPAAGEAPLRWNWDSPLIISPHAPKRLYFAGNVLFRSDDRGDSWKPVSPDLTRQLDRNKLPVMGKLWGPDAVFKHGSTSIYGNSVALAESPKKEGLIYVGTDDGLVQVTEDGGKAWRKVEQFPGVPERTYVGKLVAGQHDAGTVYACFDNHKNGDFAPYLLKSTDGGKTWVSVAGDLPARGTVYCVAEDHVDPNLLFAGTEFGLFVTLDGGKKWGRVRGGFPTIQVKDLCVQQKMNDLVIGTFGRGIYVLDDYSPLRLLSPELTAKKDAILFPVRDAVLYVPSAQFGGSGKASLGASFYTADNPPFGATFTYYLKDGLKTRKQLRKDAEKKAEKDGTPLPYPTPEELRVEAEEEAPTIFLVISDADGNVVRTVPGAVTEGTHRVTWDLRDPGATLPAPTTRREADDDDDGPPRGTGPLAAPGKYTVTLFKRYRGEASQVTGPVGFEVVLDTLGDPDPAAVAEQVAFHRRVLKLSRAVTGATNVATELGTRLDAVRRALDAAPKADEASRKKVRDMIDANRLVLRALRGDTVTAARNESVPVSIADRVRYAGGASVQSLSKPTGTQSDAYGIAAKEFAAELAKLRQLAEVDFPALEKTLDAAGAPWTPGRLPSWDGK